MSPRNLLVGILAVGVLGCAGPATRYKFPERDYQAGDPTLRVGIPPVGRIARGRIRDLGVFVSDLRTGRAVHRGTRAGPLPRS